MFTEESNVCVGCNTSLKDTNNFSWSGCNHRYCFVCGLRNIETSLSLLNQIPRCNYNNCGSLLKSHCTFYFQAVKLKPFDNKYTVDSASTHFLPRRLNILRYYHGYKPFNNKYISINVIIDLFINYESLKLKKNNTPTLQIIPNDIKMLIRDYCYLDYYKMATCTQCEGLGYNDNVCQTCEGEKTLKIKCDQCNEGIYQRMEDCSFCKGNGKLVIFSATCRKCNGNGDFRQKCTKCKGSGKYKRNYPHRKCNGTGRAGFGNYACHGCQGTGIYKVRNTCRGCKGTGIYQRDCYNCEGTGIYKRKRDCRTCDGKAQVPKSYWCNICDNRSGFKTINCDKCFRKGFIRSRCNVCNSDKQKLIIDFPKLCNRQKICKKCNLYSPISKIVYWPKCHHLWCITCFEDLVSMNAIPKCLETNCKQELTPDDLKIILKYFNYNYKLSEGLIRLRRLCYERDNFSCTGCGQYHNNDTLFLWTTCNHKYSKRCAIRHVDTSLTKEEWLFRSSIFQRIPKCTRLLCNKPLDVESGQKLGLTNYQCKTLKTLTTKESCLVM